MIQKRKLLTGVAVAATIATVGAGGYVLVGRSGSDRTAGFCALMPDAVGLYPGNPVTQMGFRVGSVDRVEAAGDHVRVSFTLESGRSYPADVKTVTRSKSVLADRTLELVGNYHAGPRLEPGQCVSLTNAATPKSLSEITGSAADFIDRLTPDNGTRPVEGAVDGLAKALAGQGGDVNSLLRHAQQAMADPDRMVAAIGSIIASSAPLTGQTLAQWDLIRQLISQLPTTLGSAPTDLWPGVQGLLQGIAPLIAVINEIQTQYGGDIWPLADNLADLIHVAATRADDIRGVLAVIPSVAEFMAKTTRNDSGAVQFRAPTLRVDLAGGPAVCDAMNTVLPGSCANIDGRQQLSGRNLLDLVLAKENK
ncbi:MlaD family protein [Nocardia nepalensis]|uniref:MlaD family protein n=1 Tax=Nocardia nepalensis TaxID=3375448 RepID=UPI003B683628